jgi:membrane protein YdbS with pleckstrin-like domain
MAQDSPGSTRSEASSAERPIEEAATFHGRASTGAPEDFRTAAERELWIGRTNWKHYAGRFLLTAAAAAALSVLIVLIARESEGVTAGWAILVILGLLLVATLFFVIPVLWIILSHRYRLTTQRLIIERGILSQTIDQTELVRVDDVRVHKTLTDRLLGLGTVHVISTDATHREVLIPGVAGPDKLADNVRNLMRTARQRTVYVENV